MRAELAVPGRYQLVSTVPAAHATWWQLFAMWLGDRWDDIARRFFPHLHVGAGAQRAAGDILVILGALVVAFAAARLLFAVQIARDRRVASMAFEPARGSAHAVARSAAAAAESGNYTLAVRLLFAAAVALLDVRGVARDRRSATINELCAAVRERYAGAEAPFSDIAQIYTVAAYAEHTADASAWERASSAYKRLAECASL